MVVCLLTHDYVAAHGADEVDDADVVIPVALEPLGARADLRGFERFERFPTDGGSYEQARQRKAAFVNELHETIAAHLRGAPDDAPIGDRHWRDLVSSRSDGAVDHDAIVKARAREASLERDPERRPAVDATVDVQEHLRAWADDATGRPFMVIFGEYGMGKTTACQVFTRALLERRRAGELDARLPIYLDLRRLGDVKHAEPTLEQILEDLLKRVWQSGPDQPPATADEVVELVQRGRALVIFDGLDEVLVHLTQTRGQALLRELWKILPPPLLADPQAQAGLGRVSMTCRTHFFRTVREQAAYFRGEDREAVGAADYSALHLLPFSDQQVRAYLALREGGASSGAVERAVALIRDVHNLSDLVQRPYNLRLVADQLGALERRIASGARIDAAGLYDELVASWLERDTGKHQLRPDDKLRLMEELAATLWRDGRRSLPASQLERWLEMQLDSDEDLRRWQRHSTIAVAVLAEDLRTATFIVRPGDDRFEFAHTSLLEYFLARRLARALIGSDAAAWALPMPSDETLGFLGELIAAGDTEACLRGLRHLRATYRPLASELAFMYCIRALRVDAPAVALAGFALAGRGCAASRSSDRKAGRC